MLDPKLLRETPDLVKASQKARGADESMVDAWIAADSRWRELNAAYDTKRAEQKNLSKEIGPLQGKAKSGDESVTAQLEELMKNASRMADDLTKTAEARDKAEAEAAQIMSGFANIVDVVTPVGGEEDFKIIETVGKPKDFKSLGFQPKDHIELGQILGAIDIERGAKVSGSRFYYLTGPGALLELALVRMAMEFATKAGFTPVLPPSLVRPQAMEGTGFLGQAAVDVYHLPADDLYLVGTSEVPLAAFHMDEILEAKQLPLRYAGFSPCFRREAGSFGKEVRGLNRVHQFEKVEIIQIVHPEKSETVLEEMVAHVEKLLMSLGLPYRILRLCGGDMGFASAITYDFEVYSAAQEKWLEVSSVSNFMNYQTYRMKCRFKDANGKIHFTHSLNGSSLALPRIFAAIVENYQTVNGIALPEVLKPYFGGQDLI